MPDGRECVRLPRAKHAADEAEGKGAREGEGEKMRGSSHWRVEIDRVVLKVV